MPKKRRRVRHSTPATAAGLNAEFGREIAAAKRLVLKADTEELTVVERAELLAHLSAARRLGRASAAATRTQLTGFSDASALIDQLDASARAALGPTSGVTAALGEVR